MSCINNYFHITLLASLYHNYISRLKRKHWKLFEEKSEIRLAPLSQYTLVTIVHSYSLLHKKVERRKKNIYRRLKKSVLCCVCVYVCVRVRALTLFYLSISQILFYRVQHCTKENLKLHKKVENLETENRTLLQQLRQLQALVARTNPIFGRPAHLGTCLMVCVCMCLCVIVSVCVSMCLCVSVCVCV